MSAALTLDLDCPPVPRRADWIDALALRAACVGGWNPTPAEFWPRLANLAFFNALLAAFTGDDGVSPRWTGGETPPVEPIATAHVLDQLETALVGGALAEAEAFDLVRCSRAFWPNLITAMPRAFAPKPDGATNTCERWWVRLAAWCGARLAHLHPVWWPLVETATKRHIAVDRFLVSRFAHWQCPGWPEPEQLRAVEDFIRWKLGPAEASTARLANLVLRDRSLGDEQRIIWDLDDWIAAGWHAAGRFEATGHEADLLSEISDKSRDYTRELVQALREAEPGGITAAGIRAGARSYVKQAAASTPTSKDIPCCCVNAFDYTFYVRLTLAEA